MICLQRQRDTTGKISRQQRRQETPRSGPQTQLICDIFSYEMNSYIFLQHNVGYLVPCHQKQKKSRIFRVSVSLQNKTDELQYKRKTYMELYKRISLKKERISSELTVSNNSLRVVTDKFFKLLMW